MHALFFTSDRPHIPKVIDTNHYSKMKGARRTTSLLALFAGPLLLAVSADAYDWVSPFNKDPTPSPDDSYDIYPDADTETDPTPSPVADSYDTPTGEYEEKETQAPTDAYVEPSETYDSKEEEEIFEEYEDTTPAPVEIEEEDTMSPTAIYVETTDGGDMSYMPVGDGDDGEDEEEEEEPMPMDEKPEGSSCSTYDEDVSTTILLTMGLCFSKSRARTKILAVHMAWKQVRWFRWGE